MSAEYSLKNINNPIAISEYKYLEELPKYLNKKLELETEKNKICKNSLQKYPDVKQIYHFEEID